ncbi:MAG: acyl-CoA thioesterase [Thermomicrobiales bacterium]
MSADPGLLPASETPVFDTYTRVRFHEVDALGHVNNAAYLNYLEQAAIDHATALGLDMPRLLELGGVFVARRHEITFLRPTFAGDLLRILTWLGEPRGARIERHSLVVREQDAQAGSAFIGQLREVAPDLDRGNLVVRATTEWVFADQRGQPRRIPGEVVDLFGSQVEYRQAQS